MWPLAHQLARTRLALQATQFTADLGVTKKTITLGFTKSNELFVGRMAMLGIAAALFGEILTGLGPLAQVGSSS